MSDPRLDRDLAPLELDCVDVRGLLGRHLDGELEEPHAGRLRGHLLACAGCRARFQDERSLKRWFEAAPEVSVPAGFAARVAALALAGASPRQARDPLLEAEVAAAVVASHGGPEGGPDGGIVRLERYTLGLLALAAAALLVLSIALAVDTQPERPTVLLADPLPDALQRLDELNREERRGEARPGTISVPVSGSRP